MAESSLSSKNFKNENSGTIWKIIAFDFTILSLILAAPSVNTLIATISLKAFLESSLLKVLLSSILGSILVKILTDILTPQIKHVIIFWRLKDTLPGHRVFSEMVNKDPRIDKENLEMRLVEFPTNPIDQNRLWYKIYQKYRNDELILDSHSKFLFFRDSCVLTIFVFIVSTTICILLKVALFQFLLVITYQILQLLILMIAGRNTGNRFVQNVLCLESHAKDE